MRIKDSARLAADSSDYQAVAANSIEQQRLVEQTERDVERWA